MNVKSRFRTWWQAVTRGAAVNAQLDEELRFHVESYAEDLMRLGMPREEATRRARAEIGSLAAARENSRQAWGTRWFDEILGDIRYALRMLAKSPAFAAIAIGSLALGIGANTAIFSIAKHALLDRLNVPHSRDLVLFEWTGKRDSVVHSIWGMFDRGLDGVYSTSFSYPAYQTLRSQNHSLEDIFAFKDSGRMNITVDGNAEVVQSELVSGNYYEQLEVKPELGRAIGPEDEAKPGASPVIVISDAYWSRRFGRSPSVIGKTVTVNFISMTIVGVNPPGFTGAKSVQTSPEIFAPLAMAPQLVTNPWRTSLLEDPKHWWVIVMARRKPYASEAAAQAELGTVLHNVIQSTLQPKPDESIPRLVLTDGSRGLNEASYQLQHPLSVLLAMTGLVLLLACTNVANLLLARATARQREMSVRLALGAGRSRILRQSLTESILLSLCGGAVGTIVAIAGQQGLLQLTADPENGGSIMHVPLSWGVFAFTLGLSLFTGILFGIAPALQATRTQVRSGLQDNTHTVTRRRRGYAGKAIVGIQIAISMLLVTGAGVFLRTLINLSRINPGFDAHNLVLFTIRPPASHYSPAQTAELFQRIEERLKVTPGVESEAAASVPLLADDNTFDDFTPVGVPLKSNEERGAADNWVGDDYFATMRIGLLAGRPFNAHDTAASSRVAIINLALARKYWGSASAIGRTFHTSDDQNRTLTYTIVGVCADARYADLRHDPPPQFYISYRQPPDTLRDMTFNVRTRASLAAIVPLLRSAVQGVDHDLPLDNVRTQIQQIDEITTTERMFADLTGGFGLLAMVLACIGIYGVMAYSVSQRTNEIGIRMALGAQPGRVLGMVLREASWMSVLGVGAGVAGALALSRLIASMLYGLKANDPLTFTASAVLLLLVALAASWIPARRAAGIDPMRALRHE